MLREVAQATQGEHAGPILRSRYDHTVLGTEIGPFTNNPG